MRCGDCLSDIPTHQPRIGVILERPLSDGRKIQRREGTLCTACWGNIMLRIQDEHAAAREEKD